MIGNPETSHSDPPRLLTDAIGLEELEVVRTESAVESFRIDVLATRIDDSGEEIGVVIENQYGKAITTISAGSMRAEPNSPHAGLASPPSDAGEQEQDSDGRLGARQRAEFGLHNGTHMDHRESRKRRNRVQPFGGWAVIPNSE